MTVNCFSADPLINRLRSYGKWAIRQSLLITILFVAVMGAMPVLAPFCSAAQVPRARPQFEVATVKANLSGCCTSSKWSTDQVVFSNQTLMHLVLFAYRLQPHQLICPEWMQSTRFDITAKYPPGTKFPDRLLMLQTLLQDRFKLTVHSEKKEMQAYELMVATTGFKLKPSEPGEGSTVSGVQGGIRTFRARKISMSDLAYDLADSLGETVLDETSLNGVYDVQLSWAADDLSSGDAKAAPSVFTAVQDSLGLRLEHRKTLVPVVVVDYVDRIPSEN